MAANKIVPGLKDYIYSLPNTKGTKDDQELLRLRNWSKKKKKKKTVIAKHNQDVNSYG
jgi:hypothetical protein